MKVLIVGLGSIASKHMAALRELDASTEIIALRSSNAINSVDQVRNIYEWDSIKDEAPDFIIISNPTSLHFETIQKLKYSSIPLFIEKPLFSKIGSKENDLVKEIMKQNTHSYVACNLRFLDSIQKLKNIVNNERINEVNVYCGSYLPDWRPNINFRENYSANKEMGGGVHLDLIHELDYTYWLFGNPKNSKSFFSSKSCLNINAIDYANYIWEYDSFSASIILNYYRRDAKRHIEILTQNGTYFVDILKNQIFLNDKPIFISEQKPADTYKVQLENFIKMIKGERTNIANSVYEAYKILELCLKV